MSEITMNNDNYFSDSDHSVLSVPESWADTESLTSEEETYLLYQYGLTSNVFMELWTPVGLIREDYVLIAHYEEHCLIYDILTREYMLMVETPFGTGAHYNDVNEFDVRYMIVRNNWFMYGLNIQFLSETPHIDMMTVPQSGVEECNDPLPDDKNYRRSVYERRERDVKNLSKKVLKKMADSTGKNLGSGKKRRKQKNLLKKCKYIGKQSGEASDEEINLNTSYISDFLKGANMTLSTENAIFTIIEKVIIYMFRSKLSSTFGEAFTCILATAPGSLMGGVKMLWKKHGKKLMNLNMTTVLDYFKNLKSKWSEILSNHDLLSALSFISTFFVSIICPTLGFQFDSFQFIRFTKKIKRLMGPHDIIYGLFNLIIYITKGVKKFLQTGSIDGFFFSDDDYTTLNERFLTISLENNSFRIGDMDIPTRMRHIFEVGELEKDLKVAMKVSTNLQQKNIQRMYTQISKIKIDINTSISHAKTRMAPYSFAIVSGTGISKSHITKVLTKIVLEGNGFPSGDDFTYYFVDNDPYVSGWQNHNTAIIFDDVGNSIPEPGKGQNHQNFLLKSVNNQPHNLVTARLEDKSMMWNNSLLNVVNGNFSHLQIEALTKRPTATYRRLKSLIVGKVKKEYRKSFYNEKTKETTYSSEIDYSKVPTDRNGDIDPDAWFFDVYKFVVAGKDTEIKTSFGEPTPEDSDDHWMWTYDKEKLMRRLPTGDIGLQEVLLKDISFSELCQFAAKRSKEHFAVQKTVLNCSSVVDSAPLCDCGLIKDMCLLCKNVETDVPKEEVETWEDINSPEVSDVVEDIEMPNSTTKLQELKDRQRKNLKEVKTRLASVRKIPNEENLEKQAGLFLKCNTNIIKELDDVEVYLTELTKEVTALLGDGSLSQSISKLERVVFSLVTSTAKAIVGFAVYVFFQEIKRRYKTYDLVPVWLEDTIVVKWFYAQDWNLRFCIILDMIAESMNYFLHCILLRKPMVCPEVNFFKYRYLNYVRGKYNCTKSLYYNFYTHIGRFSNKLLEYKSETNDHARDKGIPLLVGAVVMRGAFESLWKGIERYHNEAQGGDLEIEDDIVDSNALQETKPDLTSEDPLKRPPDTWYQRDVILDSPSDITIRTHEETFSIVAKNTVRVLYHRERDGVKHFSNGLMVFTNYILLPWHEVKENFGALITVCRKEKVTGSKVGNAIFKNYISEKEAYKFPDKDLCLLRVENTGNVKDLRSCFPTTRLENPGPIQIVYRNRSGKVESYTGINTIYKRYACNDYSNRNDTNTSHGYMSKVTTFAGLCGAPWITVGNNRACILGIHAGGHVETGIGMSYSLTQEDIEGLISQHNITVFKQGGFEYESFGIKLYDSKIHQKSPLAQESFPGAYMVGSSTKRSSFDTTVRKTLISDDVKTEFDIKEEWSPPCLRGPTGTDKRHYIKHVLGKLVDKVGYPVEEVEYARQDLKNQIFKALEEGYDGDKNFWRDSIRPLEGDAIYLGEENEPMLKAMNFQTSVGKHLGGAKERYFDIVDGKRTPHDIIREDYNRKEEKWKNCERTFEVYSAYPKDEAITSEQFSRNKVRTFYGSDITHQAGMRKILLRMTRFFYCRPDASECKVGINAHHTDWNKFLKYIDKIEGDNYIAGDFKGFDISMNPKVLRAAWDILTDIAIWTGNFSDEDMNMFKTLGEEIVNNIIDFNGDLISIPGIILSGIIGTSILGGLCVSLLLRIAFFKNYKHLGQFNKHVRLGTYGDDFVGKVSLDCPLFTVDNIIGTLDPGGIVMTNCWKTDEKVSYMKRSELEFLKRSFTYNGDFGFFVAALNINSIHKMLCYKTRNSLDALYHSVVVIENALIELKFHGRTTYERYREGFRKILIKHGILDYSRQIDVSYDQAVSQWKDKYIYGKETVGIDVNTPLIIKRGVDFDMRTIEQLGAEVKKWKERKMLTALNDAPINKGLYDLGVITDLLDENCESGV